MSGRKPRERAQHFAQGFGRPLDVPLVSPMRKSALPPTLFENGSHDLAPQGVLGPEVVNDELVLQTGVVGDLAQAGTFETVRCEDLKRRSEDAGASIVNVRDLGLRGHGTSGLDP